MPAPLTEAELLRLLAPTGLDWKTPLSAFVARHGVTKPYGWQEVVQLPPSRGLSTEPISWSTQLHRAPLDLPPAYLSADAWPFAEAERNLEAALGWLQPALGDGERNDSANTRGVVWSIGAFTVEVTVWPPALQSAHRGPNALHQAEPRLATAAHFVLESALAHLEPDEALLPLAHSSVRDLGEHRLNIHYRFGRRLPAALLAAWPPARTIAWQLGDRFGLASQGMALTLPLPGSTLTLDRVLPARAPGHAALRAQVGDDSVTLLRGPDTASLDATAASLARWWGMPLRVDEYEAD